MLERYRDVFVSAAAFPERPPSGCEPLKVMLLGAFGIAVASFPIFGMIETNANRAGAFTALSIYGLVVGLCGASAMHLMAVPLLKSRIPPLRHCGRPLSDATQGLRLWHVLQPVLCRGWWHHAPVELGAAGYRLASRGRVLGLGWRGNDACYGGRCHGAWVVSMGRGLYLRRSGHLPSHLLQKAGHVWF